MKSCGKDIFLNLKYGPFVEMRASGSSPKTPPEELSSFVSLKLRWAQESSRYVDSRRKTVIPWEKFTVTGIPNREE